VDTTGSGGAVGTSAWRFQLSNHLGSSALELTRSGAVISYEEYHPFGSTAFHTAQGSLGVSLKRYRYTGKERDEETGLYYHGARYYAPWLGRWTAADPLGIAQPGRADLNLYAYVRNRPLVASDPTGLDGAVVEPAAPQTDRQKIESALRAYGVDVGGPPPMIDDAVALQMLRSGVAKPEGEITIGDETFLPEMTITGDAELAGRAKAAGNSVELQDFLENTPGVIQKQDVTGFLKGLVNSPTATVEGVSRLVGLDLQLPEFKLELNPNEGSGSLIGEGLGPGPLAVAGATAKGLGKLGKAFQLVPSLPSSEGLRVTQFYDPFRGGFGPDALKALESAPPTNVVERILDGTAGGAWVAPKAATDLGWFSRMMTGRGTYAHYVEFGATADELIAPGGVKALYAPWQRVIPGGASFSDRAATFGQLGPNYGMYLFLGGLGVGAVGLGYYGATR